MIKLIQKNLQKVFFQIFMFKLSKLIFLMILLNKNIFYIYNSIS